MYITHLSLSNFRNYKNLELDISPHITILQGDNAQGKSNLLEAIYLLSTSRSHRTTFDREFINWSTLKEDIPVCRVAADIRREKRDLQLEIALLIKDKKNLNNMENIADTPLQSGFAQLQKRIRINSIPRRAIDLVGQINVIPFSTIDIDIIRGEPALRRRYLDMTISQIDRQYLRHLLKYHRVVLQRNRLLRRISEHKARPNELAYWNQELLQTGSYIVLKRDHFITAVNGLIENIYDELSGGQGKLQLVYHRNIDRKVSKGDLKIEDIIDLFSHSLESAYDKEMTRGISLVGPHRDELRFIIHGIDQGIYGSRGQQRIVALSLKLAEAQFMLSTINETPILLLDDVLSELDHIRRSLLLDSIIKYEQVLMTVTDLDYFQSQFLSEAVKLKVIDGNIEPYTA